MKHTLGDVGQIQSVSSPDYFHHILSGPIETWAFHFNLDLDPLAIKDLIELLTRSLLKLKKRGALIKLI